MTANEMDIINIHVRGKLYGVGPGKKIFSYYFRFQTFRKYP